MMWSQFFYHNCTDEGIQNALDRRRIQSFMELSHIVQKYRVMESTWKAQKTQLEPAVFKQCTAQAKLVNQYEASDHKPVDKKTNPLWDAV